MSFILLNRRNKLIFSAPIECAAKSIRKTTVYTTLNINIYKAKSLYINMSGIKT